MLLGDSKTFDRLYAKLNNRQKEAVDAIEGPVMVVAGPGTGKTQILTLRIANIRRLTDTSPDAILALTFTESGVASMRKRLTEIIGNDAYQVEITTFHGFCNDIIKRYPNQFPSIIGSTNITEIDQIAILQDCITNNSFKKLKPFGDPLYYIKTIKSAITELKRENISPEAFQAVVKDMRKNYEAITDTTHTSGPHKGKIKSEYIKQQERVEKNEDLGYIYKEYQESMQKNRWYDYSDMIMEVVRALEADEHLRILLQERFSYILVDEHQDTNNAQNTLLKLLCSFDAQPNLFIVGDEKQAIFRFQGASLENFLYFKELYPSARLIVLEDNYRSSQTLLDASHGLARTMNEKTVQLKAQTKHENQLITLCATSHPDVECYIVGTKIKEHIQKKVLPHEIAVLYRDNRDALLISEVFEKMAIPFVIESDRDVLSDVDIQKWITIARAVNCFGEDEALVALLHIDFLNLDPLDVYKLILYGSKNRISLYECLKSTEIHERARIEKSDSLINIYQHLIKWVRLAKNELCVLVCEALMRESGFLAYILASRDAIEKMEKVNGLFDEIKEFSQTHPEGKLADSIKYIDALKTHDVLIKKKNLSVKNGRVRLMTAHKSKGLEFEYVYIINAYDTHWGNKRNKAGVELPESLFSLSSREIKKAEANDDERRLFYVALTRAKKGACISYAKQSREGRQQLPTQFIQECDHVHIQQEDVSSYEKIFAENRGVLYNQSARIGAGLKDVEFVNELFQKEGLSVTALNNYLSCPWKYFYTNLLRIPKAKTKHQYYGTAVHAAIKDFFEDRNQKVDRNDAWLAKRFDSYLKEQQIHPKDYEEAKEKGMRALIGWWKQYHTIWPAQSRNEFSINGVVLNNSIRLTGKIDKIEILKEGSKSVTVVDYKTGKPKSRGEIEGTTKESNGDMKRQLIFYKLLLSLYENGTYYMETGEIDFIEPNERGIFKKESYCIEQDEVEDLKETITRVAKEICSLSFWDARCAEKECEFCALRDALEIKLQNKDTCK